MGHPTAALTASTSSSQPGSWRPFPGCTVSLPALDPLPDACARALLPRRPQCNSTDDTVKDHCNLEVLNAATLVENTRRRFLDDKIYTYISQLLIAVNPFKRIPGVYDDSVKEVYKGANWSQLDPHVFAIAEMSYQSMVMHNQSQSLLVSGESGAGKTETNKQLMDYLIWRAGVNSSVRTSKVATLARRILDTNPVLEAFGNAKSIRNNNSSRFGKYINLKFNKEYKVMGAEVRTFLLEKSRVTNASLPRERSYHIFYQLLAGSQQEGSGQPVLKGKTPADFRYTNLSRTGFVDSIDDKAEFQAMDNALDSVGLEPTEITQLYDILTSLLYLGNVKIAGEDSINVTPDSEAALRQAEKLLGIGNIQQLLIEKVVKSPRSNNEYHIALDLDAAVSQRDALVKHLYQLLFHLVVEKINVQIAVDKDFHRFIGLLDVFGFEVFDTNSFEQLCINYANERLHNFFLMRVFEVEIELYKMQNLQVPVLIYPDNSKVIELLEKSPTGIFPMLDAQCKMPKGSDINFNGAICKQHATHAHFSTLSASKLKLNGVSDADVFVIHHYAGDVCYSSAGFLGKNTDQLSAQFEKQLKNSSNSLVYQMVVKPSDGANKGEMSARGKRASATGGGTNRAGKTTNRGAGGAQKQSGSVSKMFLLGLKQLMREIATTHPFFIRCIKPNQTLVPGDLNTSMVLSQMERSGTIECVKLMQAGFPSRAPYTDLQTRFKSCLPEFMLSLEPMEFVELLLLACECGPGDYQLGQDMVFFRANKGGVLQELMMMRKDLVASRIVENGKLQGFDKDPQTAAHMAQLAEFVQMRKKQREEALRLFQDAILASMRMMQWVKWGEDKMFKRSTASIRVQAVRRGRAARLQAVQMRKQAADKKAAEEAAHKAAEEARLAAEAAHAAEAAEAADAQRKAAEMQAAADKARKEMEDAAEAVRLAEKEDAERRKQAEVAKAAADAEKAKLQAASDEHHAAIIDGLVDDDDHDDHHEEKWFVKVRKSPQEPAYEVHRYLMCKGVEWGFQYHNFYGDWELASNEPMCNGRPHYVHNTMYGGHAHLFHTIDPHYHVPRWVIGPAPGNENGWAFCESDASTPHEVQATWISWDGFEWHSCKSFRYVPKEHEMDGLSDEEDFELDDDDWNDENQFGSLSSMLAEEETANEDKKIVTMTKDDFEEMMTNREMSRRETVTAAKPAAVVDIAEPLTSPIVEEALAGEAPASAEQEDTKKGKKGKKGDKEKKSGGGMFK